MVGGGPLRLRSLHPSERPPPNGRPVKPIRTIRSSTESRLKEALRLYSHPRLKPNQSEANYLTACVRLAKRNQRRMIIGLSALVILAAVAWWKWRAVNDLVAKNAEIASNLDHANENRQTTLAKSLLRPIGLTAPKISPAERIAYNELVALPADQERVRFQFIALALSVPPSAERFWRSAPVPIHAAVQFDVERRRKVLQETNLSDCLQDQSTPLSVRKACPAIGVELSATCFTRRSRNSQLLRCVRP